MFSPVDASGKGLLEQPEVHSKCVHTLNSLMEILAMFNMAIHHFK